MSEFTDTVRVLDGIVRRFHSPLIVAVLVAYLSASYNFMTIHSRVGYTLCVLVTLHAGFAIGWVV